MGIGLVLLLLASAWLFVLVVLETRAGRPPTVETSWGGFGGGRGGWRLSPALVFLLGSILFGGLFGTLAVRVIDSPEFHAWTGVAEAPDTTDQQDVAGMDRNAGNVLAEPRSAEPDEGGEAAGDDDPNAAASDGGEG